MYESAVHVRHTHIVHVRDVRWPLRPWFGCYTEHSLPTPRSLSNVNVGPRIFIVLPQGPDLKEYALLVPQRSTSWVPFSVLTNGSLDHGMDGEEGDFRTCLESLPIIFRDY